MTATRTPAAKDGLHGHGNDRRRLPRPRDRPPNARVLAEVNKDSSPFWELGRQPRAIVTGLRTETPVDLSGDESAT